MNEYHFVFAKNKIKLALTCVNCFYNDWPYEIKGH